MSLKVQVDWDKSGDYSSVFDDVSLLVRRAQGALTAEYGRDQSTALAPTVSGRGSFVLDNRDRRFSPRNTASPLYGKLKPARPVKITRTINGVDYVLFVAHTDDNPLNPDINSKTVSVTLVDSLSDFRGINISTPLYRGIRTGEAIGYILDAVGWGIYRDLDAGATVIPWWWEEGTDALTALEKVLRSEGPPALLTVGADGSIVFKDRHHRLINTASTTSQQTWRSLPGVEPVMQAFQYDEAWRNIINNASADVDIRTPGEVTDVWTSDTQLTLANGEVRTITATSSDPFYDAIPPEDGVDFTTLSGSVTATLTRTSGAATTIVLTASGASVIDGLKLRANPVPVAYTVQVAASDGASISDYGSRGFPGDVPFANQYDADAVLANAVALRSQPVPIITVEFLISSLIPNKPAMLLARDLSDMVTVVESETATNSDFYIENIAHEATSGLDHKIRFGCEAVPTTVGPLAITDSTDSAAYTDSGKTAFAVDNPVTVAVCDSADSARFTDAGTAAT